MKTIIFAVAAALVSVIVLVYVLVAPTRPVVVPEERRAQDSVPVLNPIESGPIRGSGSLRSLFLQSRPLECAIVYRAEPTAVVEGTYFVSDNRLRGDFVSRHEEMEVVSSMILVDDVLFTWSQIMGERYGLRVDLTQVQLGAADQPAVREPVPLDAVVEYDCRPWTAFDASIFVPPGDILWQDYSAIIERGMEAPVLYE